MINTYIPFFKKKDQNILKNVLRLIMFQLQGPLIQKFENKFNSKFRFNHSIAL